LDEAAGKATLRQSLDADKDARGLATVGPYLLLKNYRRVQVFDAQTLRVLLQQDNDTSEEFVFVDPPQGSSPGLVASIELQPGKGGDWRKHAPQFRLISLADGREATRWPCPIVEDGQNDHRFQARFAMSPQRNVVAIAQAGRVNFFRFKDAARLGSFPTADKYVSPSVTFLSEKHALVSAGSTGGQVRVVDVASGGALADIPDSDFFPTVSRDGRRILLRRNELPLEHEGDKPRSWTVLQHGLVVLWKQTGEYK